MMPTYSILIPLYNEEENILILYNRLLQVINSYNQSFEIIFVDDGSKDNSLRCLQELEARDNRVKYLSLARNFGHQVAVTAGLNHVHGSCIIILDADLQDPPELIPALIEQWKNGNHVVYAKRTFRHNESIAKRYTAFLFYRLLTKLAEVEIPTDAGDFCLLDRKVVDILNAMPERNRYIRGLRSWVGFNQVAVEYERDSRNAGSVKYTFAKSLKLALNATFSFSNVPLRVATYTGVISAVAAIIMAFLVLYWRIFQPHSAVHGFTTILMVVFFLGAIQLITVGILGEYIGRIYEEVKARPLYTIKEAVGFEKERKAFLYKEMTGNKLYKTVQL